MSTIGSRLASLLFPSDPDAGLSAEFVRNEEARLRLSAARVAHDARERSREAAFEALDGALADRRADYAERARPLLATVDAVSPAAPAYEGAVEALRGQRAMAARLAADELGHFAYLSKKLLSVALNAAALRRAWQAGEPFAGELHALLEDAESDDLRVMAAPLAAFAGEGAPRGEAVRAAAWGLARAIEETGKAPAEEPVRGWLDFLKFRTSFSPTALQMNQTLARGKAQVFMRHMNRADYPKALSVADEVFQNMDKEKEATYETFLTTYRNFRKVVFPHIAADTFDIYTQSSLIDSRFACVESMLKE